MCIANLIRLSSRISLLLFWFLFRFVLLLLLSLRVPTVSHSMRVYDCLTAFCAPKNSGKKIWVFIYGIAQYARRRNVCNTKTPKKSNKIVSNHKRCVERARTTVRTNETVDAKEKKKYKNIKNSTARIPAT